MEEIWKAARINSFALESTFSRRKTKNGFVLCSMVAVNRGFHGGKPRGEPSLKRLMNHFLSDRRSDKIIERQRINSQ